MPAPHESSINQLLGHPDDARPLLINADDFGMCHANNAATLRELLTGIATSTSLMRPCPCAAHALRLVTEHSGVTYGLLCATAQAA